MLPDVGRIGYLGHGDRFWPGSPVQSMYARISTHKYPDGE
jgi:hypothetical protein